VDDLTAVVRAKDVERVMSFCAPEAVSFDLTPPLRYAGADRERLAWLEMFAAYAGPISYEVRELKVTTAGELALVHSLNRVSGTDAGGHAADLWLRWTAFFRRTDGAWRIVHDHVSVPADSSMAGRP
jgi:ketosteroid isomerase-like protein